MKGGSYLDGNRCDYNRCSYRLSTGKTVKYEMRGFRLNGVIRPAYRIHQAYMYRCGMRYGYAGRNTVWNGYIGFRTVNGVYRGGTYQNVKRNPNVS